MKMPAAFPPPMVRSFFPGRELKMGRLSFNALVTSAYPLNAMPKFVVAGALLVELQVHLYQPLYRIGFDAVGAKETVGLEVEEG